MNITFGNSRIFYNSQTLVCQYYDILKSPWFPLLNSIIQIEELQALFDFSDIDYLGTNGLYEWYVYRENRNFLYDLAKSSSLNEKETRSLDNLLENLSMNNYFYEEDTSLNFFMTLKEVINYKDLISKIIIYEKNVNDFMREDIKKHFGIKVSVVGGEFNDLLKNITNDTTFILSDISLINDIINANLLDFSSIIIPDDYKYVKKGMEKINTIELSKNHVFKFDIFDNIHQDFIE